ncbi:MAG TPA: oligosaccharide flippase family protein [Limnochordales bacterium]|nr:oligosaccharide flippase family protein [Limnochordales bacterium]
MRRRPLLKGALMLMAAGAMTRALGTLYRILIVRWAGAEALGLFQMVLPLYRMASTMATLRLPVALTQVTADALARGRLDQVHRARRVTAALIMAMTGLTALTVVGAAPFLAGRYLTDPRTGLLILLLPLAFVPSALTGIFRGFAEGRQNMASTATGQVVEQLIRVPVVLLCLSWWGGRGVEYAAAALVVGLGAGETAGLITAMIMSGWWRLPRPAASGGARAPWSGWARILRPPVFLVLDHLQTARALLGLSLPLWVATMVNTAAQMINVGLIPRRLLAAGVSMAAATELYGQLTGMVLPLLYMPMLLVFPVATVLTPAIADAWALGQHGRARRRFYLATAGALAVGLATTALCWAFPAALPRLLYGMPEVAPLVRVAGLAAPFAFTANIFASVLYALGKTALVLSTFILTTVVRLGLIYVLTADPHLGIVGALWAIVADYALTALLNGWACLRWLRG